MFLPFPNLILCLIISLFQADEWVFEENLTFVPPPFWPKMMKKQKKIIFPKKETFFSKIKDNVSLPFPHWFYDKYHYFNWTNESSKKSWLLFLPCFGQKFEKKENTHFPKIVHVQTCYLMVYWFTSIGFMVSSFISSGWMSLRRKPDFCCPSVSAKNDKK